MTRVVFSAVGFLAAMVAAAVPAPAADEEQKKRLAPAPIGIFGIHWENDLFAGTDRGYTHGVRIFWISPEIGVGNGCPALPRVWEKLVRRLPVPASPSARRFLSVSLGQNIFTPDDITRSALIPEDRPYAGFTYAGLGFYGRSPTVLDGFETVIGVVGPLSLAGDLQKFLHRTFRWTRPEGWDNQLRNELVLGLSAERKWKVINPTPARDFGWDAFVRAGGRLSNAVTGIGGGVEIRVGWTLPHDFGSSFLLPGIGNGVHIEDRNGRHRTFHTFAVIEVQSVLRDVFLDGNTFKDSHRVAREALVADFALGLAFQNGAVRVSFAYVARSRRFVGQTYKEIFGALALSLRA